MCEALAKPLNELRQQTEYSTDGDFVFASPTLAGKRPLWGQTINARFVKPAAVVGEGDDQGHHGQSDDAAPCQTRYHGDLHAREFWEGVGSSVRVHGATAADEVRLGVNPMKSSNHRVGKIWQAEQPSACKWFNHIKDGGRYRIRTYDFHRVKVARRFVIRELRGTLGSAQECSGAYFSKTYERGPESWTHKRTHVKPGWHPVFVSTRFAFWRWQSRHCGLVSSARWPLGPHNCPKSAQ